MRKKVWKIFCGFLGVMLLFTLLSRAVTGASMAKVQTERISAGTIEHTVTGTGRVEAKRAVAVYTRSGQRVKEVCVQEGQTVKEQDVLFQLDLDTLEEQILTAQQELEKLKLQKQDAQSSQEQTRQSRETARNRAQEDYNQTAAESDHAVTQAKADWEAAEQALQDFLAQEAAGNPSVDGDEKEGEGITGEKGGDTQEDSEAEDAAAAAQKAALEQAVSEAKAAYDAAVQERDEKVKAAARALEDAKVQIPADSSVKQSEITIKQQELTLRKLEELRQAEGKITAPVSGQVTEVLIAPGDLTSEGTAIRLADTSQGCELTVSVDDSQEKYVSKGSPVKIKPSGEKADVTDYKVTNVVKNEKDEGLLDITVELPAGILEAGTMAEVEIVPDSQTYQTVLPLSALHQEQNETYVLVLQETQGVLGSELTALKLNVEVVDKNSQKAALRDGILTSEQEVITASSKAVGEGSRVRRQQ